MILQIDIKIDRRRKFTLSRKKERSSGELELVVGLGAMKVGVKWWEDQ